MTPGRKEGQHGGNSLGATKAPGTKTMEFAKGIGCMSNPARAAEAKEVRGAPTPYLTL